MRPQTGYLPVIIDGVEFVRRRSPNYLGSNNHRTTPLIELVCYDRDVSYRKVKRLIRQYAEDNGYQEPIFRREQDVFTYGVLAGN